MTSASWVELLQRMSWLHSNCSLELYPRDGDDGGTCSSVTLLDSSDVTRPVVAVRVTSPVPVDGVGPVSDNRGLGRAAAGPARRSASGSCRRRRRAARTDCRIYDGVTHATGLVHHSGSGCVVDRLKGDRIRDLPAVRLDIVVD